MIVLDASVVIAHLAIRDEHSREAFDILDSEDDLLIHPVNLAETLVRPARDGDAETTRARIDRIGIEQATPPDNEPLAVAQLRANTGMRLPDCYALVTAIREHATLATFDARLARAAIEHGVGLLGRT